MTATTGWGTDDPPSDRISQIDALADLIFADDRWDHPLTWSDAWNAARVAVDSGWQRQNGSEPAPCSHCEGTGKHTAMHPKWDEDPCRDCGGSGLDSGSQGPAE